MTKYNQIKPKIILLLVIALKFLIGCQNSNIQAKNNQVFRYNEHKNINSLLKHAKLNYLPKHGGNRDEVIK